MHSIFQIILVSIAYVFKFLLLVQPVPAGKEQDVMMKKEKALQFISVNKRGLFKDLYNECCIECCQVEEINEAGIFNKTRVQVKKITLF